MIVAGFYTNEKYRLLAERMKESAEKLGLKVSLTDYPEVASWSAALRLKVKFIKDFLSGQKDDLLYVDADTWFERAPEELLAPGDFDVALCYLLPRHPLGCTLFLRNNLKTRSLVDSWDKMFSKYPGTRLDETLLEYALDDAKKANGLIVHHLPPAYGWMKYMERRFPGAKPVIHHIGAGEGTDKMEVWAEAGSPYKIN